MRNQKSGNRGYYIALVLCAVAIGISGYLYYQNANKENQQLSNPDTTVAATLPAEDDVPVVATQPGGTLSGDSTENTVPSTATTPVQRKPIRTAAPVAGQTVAAYAMDSLSYNATTRDWRVHNGLDITAETGTQVCAAADGTVYTVFEDETMGMTVVISHTDGYTTCYSSLAAEVLVEPGDSVKLGQAIGCVGQTALLESAIGDHVHFSVTQNGEPMDPAVFLASD